MIVDPLDIFDEAIEMTKEVVEIAIENREADNLPGGEASPIVTTEPTPEPVVTTTEPVTAPDNPPIVTTEEASEELQRLRAEAQTEYEERLSEAKDLHAQASIKVMEIAKELKDAKREQKEALEEFFNLQLSGPQLPTSVPSLAGSSKGKKKKSTEPVTELPKDLEAMIEADTTWRDIPAMEVLSGIPGLGPKKRDLLLETFANCGQMEDLRGEASKQFKSFQELLPEGIGPSLADKLQERCYEVMKNHWAKLRSKIAVANQPAREGETVEADKTEESKQETALAQEPVAPQSGITVSLDDALLDDSDLI